MPWPRHLLQSVEIPAVTQTRVSDDYTPGNSQWEIGDTTILAHALGLAAFKDVSYTYMYNVHVDVLYIAQLGHLRMTNTTKYSSPKAVCFQGKGLPKTLQTP